jgi:hypothetical protein
LLHGVFSGDWHESRRLKNDKLCSISLRREVTRSRFESWERLWQETDEVGDLAQVPTFMLKVAGQ